MCRGRAADQRGVALVEFALVLPLVLLLLFGMIDFGKAINYWNDETHLANEAARQAVVNSCPSCASGEAINDWIRRRADSAELQKGGSSVASPGLKVCIWFPNGTHDVGDPVQVIVHAQYNWLGYLVRRWKIIPSSDLTGTSTMRLEKKYNATGVPNSDAFYTGPSPTTTPNWSGTGTC
jgi:hypothetical protein